MLSHGPATAGQRALPVAELLHLVAVLLPAWPAPPAMRRWHRRARPMADPHWLT